MPKAKRTKHVKKSTNVGSKRRLVSNHVPFHRGKNDTKFKNLYEEDVEKKKKNGNKKIKKPSIGNKTTSQTENITTNNTVRKEIGNEKNVNITDAFSKRPTISPRGINKSKAQVLQVDFEDGAPGKVNAEHNLASEYVTDDKFPNLGIFRHATKQGQSIQRNKEELDGIDKAVGKNLVTNDTLLFYNGTVNNITDYPKNITLKRILCFGDSLTKGLYARGEIYHPYTVKLRELFGQAKNVNYNIINHAINGDCVSKTMKIQLADDLQTLPKLDLVVILGGTNDLLHEDCTRKIDLFQEIKAMHMLVQNKGYRSVVVTIPESHTRTNGTNRMALSEYNDAIEDVNQKLRVYAATEKIPLCDLADEFPRHTLPGKTSMLSLWDDNVHPTAKGYDRIGEIIYGDIKSLV